MQDGLSDTVPFSLGPRGHGDSEGECTEIGVLSIHTDTGIGRSPDLHVRGSHESSPLRPLDHISTWCFGKRLHSLDFLFIEDLLSQVKNYTI